MAKNLKTLFEFVFPENLKKNANLSTTKQLSFDDLGDFIEERDRVKNALEKKLETSLKVDYTDFSNHVFFDSAEEKFAVAKDRVLTKYPYNGSTLDKNSFELTSSDYEQYIFDTWPRYVGYAALNGTTQFISASDTNNSLRPGSSSIYVSAWIQPKVSTENLILQVMSSSLSPVKAHGYEFYLSGATDPHIKFTIYSGSEKTSVSAAYTSHTSSFNNVAVIYDQPASLLSLYINNKKQVSSSVAYNSIEFTPSKVLIGSGTQAASGISSSYGYYSGSIDEVRICHTASELFHMKNYSRPINAEDYVKLHYKFNESITGTGSVDEIIVDYSSEAIHGKMLNYAAGARVSGAVMYSDPGDPILYSFHSAAIAFTASIDLSASAYDRDNNNLIFNMIPERIIDEDDNVDGLLRSFSLAMARYFDQMKLYIDQFDNLRVTNYQDANNTPDLMLPMLSKYFGFKVTEHFGDADPLSFFFGEGVLNSGSLGTSLFDIRTQFWKRILNNLPYLLKTKGKRTNLDSFFNVLGINKDNFSIKEYGYLPGSSIQDTRVYRSRTIPMLGIGTGSLGSLSSSFVKVPSFISTANTTYTVESTMQLPFISASYSGSVLTGSIWQFIDSGQTESFALLWNIDTIGDTTGKFILTGSNGLMFSSSDLEVFDGDLVYVAAGLNGTSLPFIEVRTVDNDAIDLSSSDVGATALSGVFTGSDFDFIMGATSGSVYSYQTQGFFGEYRYWNRLLSGSEFDDHALHVESVGTYDPLESPAALQGQWALNENKNTNAVGVITGIPDLSRNNNMATGSQFNANENPYKSFLFDVNYLSPSIDLKWADNKIRIRNKTELTIDDVATDTNEVALEFNLVDTLNRDISKIFSTFDILNNAIGKPVNKYRDEYSDLENLRRTYFNRLTDSIDYTRFFNLFRWFDKKLSDSIKQLLPARVKFIGGEQIVENHFLERSKYGYKYPMFRTPQEIPDIDLAITASLTGYEGSALMPSLEGDVLGTYGATKQEENSPYSELTTHPHVDGRPSAMVAEAYLHKAPLSYYEDGAEAIDRMPDMFFRQKYNGDNNLDVFNPNCSINIKNEYTKRLLDAELKDTKVGLGGKLGNGFVVNSTNSTEDQEHYFGGAKKHIILAMRCLSASSTSVALETGNEFALTGSTNLVLSQSLYDKNNVLIDTGSFVTRAFGVSNTDIQTKYGIKVSYEFSSSAQPFAATNVTVEFRDNNAWVDYHDLAEFGRVITGSNGWFTYESLLTSGSVKKEPSFAFAGGLYTPSPANVQFKVTNAVGTTHTFRNFKLEFYQQLADSGVKDFKEIDNQHTDDISYYLNRNVMPKII